MHVICLLFGHHRSLKKVRHHYMGFKSACRWCGTPMLRIEHGQWRPMTSEDEAPPANWPFSETN